MGILTEWLTAFRLKIRALLFRRKLDRDLQDELQFYLDQRERKTQASGTQAAAFGNPTALKERSRDLWTFVTLETTARDVRFGARMLRKNAGFTAAAVATLALGIGANTAIFSVVRAVLFNSLPYPNLDRLVVLHEALPKYQHSTVEVQATVDRFYKWLENNRRLGRQRPVSRRLARAH